VKLKKAILTAGAVGALGVAGSFGTFAAFTDALPDQASTYTAGTVDIAGGFNLPNTSSLSTQEPASAGTVTITNNGTEPVNVWMDQDGPVGTISDPGGAAGGFSDNLLAENIEVTSSLGLPGGGTFPLDASTRLWKVNRRGLSPLPGPGTTTTTLVPLVLQPTEVVTVNFSVKLRERGEGVGDTSALDNAMQGLSAAETLKVKAIEAGANDFGSAPYAIPFDNGL
jgi:hypothetical protein